MEVFAWFTTHGTDFLEKIGIITGWFFTIHVIHRDAEARRVGNLLELTEQHHVIWQTRSQNPQLSRIEDAGAALDTKPLSHEEQRFVTELILHLHTVYEARKAKMFSKLEGMEKDVKGFFTLPIPNAVWHLVKPYQNRDFVTFVDGCIEAKV